MAEAHAEQTGQPQTLQRQILVAQPGQPGRSTLTGKQLHRLRLKQHHTGGQPQRLGLVLELLQHRLVAEVNAIKITDAQHAAMMLGTQVVNATDQLHGGGLPCHCRRNRRII